MNAGAPVVRLLGVLLLLCAAWPQARAQDIPGYPPLEAYDRREVAMLPRFCIHTQLFRAKVPGGNDEVQIDRWSTALGPTFIHLHHYCWGLMKTNRAMLLSRDRGVRLFYLNDAVKEYDYVIERSPPDFVMLPEVLTKKGINLVRLQRGPLAVVEFERAIQLKPDYWPPYAELADYYRDTGDARKARETLEEGLKHSPDASALARRLAELKGRQP